MLPKKELPEFALLPCSFTAQLWANESDNLIGENNFVGVLNENVGEVVEFEFLVLLVSSFSSECRHCTSPLQLVILEELTLREFTCIKSSSTDNEFKLFFCIRLMSSFRVETSMSFLFILVNYILRLLK